MDLAKNRPSFVYGGLNKSNKISRSMRSATEALKPSCEGSAFNLLHLSLHHEANVTYLEKGAFYMAKKMRFGVLTKAGQAEIREKELPPLGEYDVLVKQEACNICTTDYGQWLGLREHQGYPMAGGHELSGELVALGKGVVGFEVGDKVSLIYEGCGVCEACRVGEIIQCVDDSYDMRVPSEEGYYGKLFGFADYMVRDVRSLVKMNPEIPAGERAFVEPLATVVAGLKKLRAQPMETVVVIGAGTMGLVNAQALRANGCRVIVTELVDRKIQVAKAMGFEVIDVEEADPVEKVKALTGGQGADAVVVAVGTTAANTQAMEMVKEYDGRVLLFSAGYPAPKLETDSNIVHYRRLELIGAYGASYADFLEAARMINTRVVDLSKLIEPEFFTLSQIQEAFKSASEPGKYRVSLTLQE
jgi:L-iditol 2-dehydrogenase